MDPSSSFTSYQVFEADIDLSISVEDLSISVEPSKESYTLDMPLSMPPLTSNLEQPKVESIVLGCDDQEIKLHHPDTFKIALDIFPRWFRPASGVLAVILDNKLMGQNITSLKNITEKTGYKEASVKAATNTLQVHLEGSGWQIFGRKGNWTIAEG